MNFRERVVSRAVQERHTPTGSIAASFIGCITMDRTSLHTRDKLNPLTDSPEHAFQCVLPSG